MAFAMGTHARLGAGAWAGGAGGGGRRRSRRVQGKAPGGVDDRGCPYFMMPGDLLKRVVEACRWGAGGEAGGSAAADGSGAHETLDVRLDLCRVAGGMLRK